MSKDLNLIAAIISEKDLLRAQDRGIKQEHIEGKAEVELWRFITAYHTEYRRTPPAEIILEKYDIGLPVIEESLDYWIAEVKRRILHNNMQEMFVSFTDKFNNDDPEAAYNTVRTFVKDQEARLSDELQIHSVVDMKTDFMQMYADAKSGKKGIATPWSVLTAWTNGWWKKDLSFIVARSGVGKSFMLLLLALAALKDNRKVLLISCEMSAADMASRFYAMRFNKQYSAVRKGRLSYFEEEQLMSDVEGFADRSFEIMDAEKGLDIIRIERAIEKTKADLVLVDSAYRIKPRQKARDRFEGMSLVGEDLKTFCQVYNKPIIASTQINREGGKKKRGTIMSQEDVAMSDVINWNSTNIFGLQKTGDKNKQNKLAIYPIKIRESENENRPLIVNWDFDTMDFSEVGVSDSLDPYKTDEDEDKGRNW